MIGTMILNTISSQFRRSHSLNRRILSPPNMVNLTGRENGWYNGKGKISEKKNHTYHPRLRAGATRLHKGACPHAVLCCGI